MKKIYAITKEEFDALPLTAKEKADIMGILRWYNNVNIDYSNGRYHYATGTGISATYAGDHKYIGNLYAEDVYTPEERKAHRDEANSPKYDKMWESMGD